MPSIQLNNRQLNCPRLNRQKGFTLVMSLIILTILTILGLTSTQSTRTEVAMAGNMRESDVAFQAAEAGLISAETFAEQSTSTTTYNDLNGLIAEYTVEPDYFAAGPGGLGHPHGARNPSNRNRPGVVPIRRGTQSCNNCFR